MSTTFPQGAVLNTQSFGNRPESVEVPVYLAGAPSTSFVQGSGGIFPIGKRAVDVVGLAVYTLVSLRTAGGVMSAVWVQDGSSSGTVTTVLGTANQSTVTTVGSTATISLPSAIIAPGSLTTTTTLTATLGNITATNGNFVASTLGTGILLNSPNASVAATDPAVVNGRSGRATFTSVSIAAAADLTLTITNSAITASSTIVLLDMSGATTGAALSIKSKTASSGSLAIVVTNGTGATTTTADIQIDFVVVNT